jgi:integrase
MALLRFARFCSALAIPPPGVNDSVFEGFLTELEAGSLVRNPAYVHRQAVWAWNKACRTAQSFPGRPVTPAQVGRTPQGFAWEKLPSSFLADYAAWEKWGAVHDPYDEHARGKALKASTLMIRRNHARSAVNMAIAQGTPPEELRCLADLVAPSLVKSVLRGFHAKHGGTPNAYVSSMATTLVILAKEWVKVPESQLSELKRLRSKISKLDSGLTQKNKNTLLRLDSPEALGRLQDLPQKLWVFAQSPKCPKKRRLPLAQIALMLELLLNVPLRLANVASLTFGRHISWPAGAKGKAWLLIPGTETKTGQPFEAELGVELMRMLKIYRDKIVPKFTGSRYDAIFIDVRGRQKRATTIADLFTATTREHLGFPITPHQMRHIAAEFLLDAEPGAFELLKQLLGHTNLKSTVSFYAGRDTSRAVRHHNKLIEQARANRRPKGRSGRKMCAWSETEK